ncbi:MAG TPA: DoxX family protein [Thermoanaerobaculia bacterium]|nr:DoxX family protein [Thermoanaerobaculia bacterium]
MDKPYWMLRIAFGLTAFLAGLDKFFNLLTNWEQYANPMVTKLLTISPAVLMRVAGVIEIIAGLALLAGITRLGGYVVAAWLTLIALSLIAGGHFLDVAVRDLVMAVGAFTLAKVSEVRETETVRGLKPVAHHA